MSGPRFERVSDVMFSAIGEDVVALNIERGHCYGMEQVTASVWHLLAEPRDLDTLCAELEAQYEVEPARCRSEVRQLLDQMKYEGLVQEIAPG